MNEKNFSPLVSRLQKCIGERGHLFIISAPSGAGKTTLCKAVLHRLNNLLYSVSYTTRKPRPGEQDGVDYHFIPKDEFIKKINNGKWAEWAEVYGNFYGTSAEFLEKGLSAGRDILLDIDVQGTIQILERYPESVPIFVVPPSLQELKSRLQSRGTDSEQEIERRLVSAKEEMFKKDMYQHVVCNEHLSNAVEELITIIKKYRSGGNWIE
jgi:guanylate kinase